MASAEDECRFWRMYLLVTNIGSNVLQQVVDHQATAANYFDFKDVLNKKMHDLFHLRFKKCCCGSFSSVTPITQKQWSLLYDKVSTNTCTSRGTCRHPYQAKQGITSRVMDVTLCSLILRNIFPSTSMKDVYTIRDTRNEFAHASSAALDNTAFPNAWREVSQALRNLSGSVSSTCLNDTNAALKQLKDRVLDPSELNALAIIMKDHRDYDIILEKINSLEGAQASSADERRRIERNMAELQSQLQDKELRIESLEDALREIHGRLKTQIQENAEAIAETQDTEAKSKQDNVRYEKVKTLLCENHGDRLQCVPLMPLQDRDIDLKDIYSPVLLEEDTTKEGTKGANSGNKVIEKTKDIFYSNGELVKRIFMKGEAGRGKTVFGFKLLYDWCRIQNGEQINEMQDVLSKFQFMFFVSLRHMKQGLTNIADMVCDSMQSPEKYNKVIKNILGDENVLCLVILDGLDEWSCPSHGFPDSGELDNCVLFTTTRPWKLEKLRLTYVLQDKVVVIQGLNQKSVENVIRRVVTYLHDTDTNEATCEESEERTEIAPPKDLDTRIKTYVERAQTPSMKTIMSIPMIATASCHVWYENDKGKREKNKDAMASLTYFLLAIIDLLIKRHKREDQDERDDPQGRRKGLQTTHKTSKKSTFWYRMKSVLVRHHVPSSTNMMNLLSRFFSNIIDFMRVIMPFSELAYHDLIGEETRLVFEKKHLEETMGGTIVDLALKVGLISQCRVPGSFNKQIVSVSFFHKLIQEVMAAMYICRNTHIIEEFCEHCDSVDKILDLRNVILLTSGLDSSLGCQLWRHVNDVARRDPDLINWRKKMISKSDKVLSLYHTRCEWYNEMAHVVELLGITQQQNNGIFDVFIKYNSDSETVRATKELMRNTQNTIMSVYLDTVSEISSIIMYLPQHSKSLTALGIMLCDVQSCEKLASVIPQLTKLQCLLYWGQKRDLDSNVVAALANLTRLESIDFSDIKLGNQTLNFSHMAKLETLDFCGVYMSAESWKEFLKSLLGKKQDVRVNLVNTDIDADSTSMMKSSPQFTLSS